jgi:hypothetical protein
MNHPSGVLSGMDEMDIALEAGWEDDPQKFVSALMECGFLNKNDVGGYVLHDWEEHQSYVVHAEDRQRVARTAAAKRWGDKGQCLSNTEASTEQCHPHADSNATRIPSAKSGQCSGNANSMLGACSEHADSMLTACSEQCPSSSSSSSSRRKKDSPRACAREGDAEAPPETEFSSAPAHVSRPETEPLSVPGRDIERVVQRHQNEISAEFANKSPKITAKLISDGCNTVDKLIRLDGYSLEEVDRVLTWARTDAFWRTQFLSVAALRSKGKNGNSKFANMAVRCETESGNYDPCARTGGTI